MGGGKGVLNPLGDPALTATNKVTSAISPAIGAAERAVNDLDKSPQQVAQQAKAVEASKANASTVLTGTTGDTTTKTDQGTVLGAS